MLKRVTKDGTNALRLATEKENIEVIEVFIRDITTVQRLALLYLVNDGMNSFHFAAFKGYTDLISLFLKGLNEEQHLNLLNQTDNSGRTPIITAAEYGNLDALKAMLHGLNSKLRHSLFEKNKVGAQAILLAHAHGYSHVVEFLEACGVKLPKNSKPIRSKEHETAAQIATALAGRYLRSVTLDEERALNGWARNESEINEKKKYSKVMLEIIAKRKNERPEHSLKSDTGPKHDPQLAKDIRQKNEVRRKKNMQQIMEQSQVQSNLNHLVDECKHELFAWLEKIGASAELKVFKTLMKDSNFRETRCLLPCRRPLLWCGATPMMLHYVPRLDRGRHRVVILKRYLNKVIDYILSVFEQ